MSADSERVEYLIGIGVDPQKAKQAVQYFDAMDKGAKSLKKSTDDATKGLQQLVEQGRHLREVGAVMAGLGASILAPIALAANQYAQAYKGLEPQANAFNKALDNQKKATEALGRVAATALVPVMNQVAAFTSRIAQFSADHPELVSAAVGVGAGLVAGGGALVAAGTAVATIARAAEVLKGVTGGGGAIKAMGEAAVYVGALAAGAKIAEIGLNKIGDATGDASLSTFQLSDALKTVREIVAGALLGLAQDFVNAKMTVGRLADIIVAVATVLKSKFDSIVDSVATGIRKFIILLQGVVDGIKNNFIDMINGLIKGLNDTKLFNIASIDKGPGFNTQDELLKQDIGFAMREDARNNALKALADTMATNDTARQQQYATDMANLKSVADVALKFVQTGTIPGLSDIFQKVIDVAKNFFGGGSTAAKPGNALGYDPEAVKDFIDRNQKLAASDRQYGIDRANLTRDYNNNELKAKRDQNAQLAQLDLDQQNAIRNSNETFQADQAKALTEFQFNETQIQQKSAFDRLQKLRETQFQMRDLAAQGDVGAFVRAANQHAFETKAQIAQDNFDAQQRAAKFKLDQAEATAQHNREISDLQRDGREKRSQLLRQFQLEDNDRQTAYQQQLLALQQKHVQEKQEIDRAFAEQLAALSSNLAGLNDIQNAYYQQQNTAMQAWVNQNTANLQRLYNGQYAQSSAPMAAAAKAATASISATQPISSGSTNPVTNFANWLWGGSVTGNSGGNNRAPVGSGLHYYASGSDYIPYDQLAMLHRGERVVNARDNMAGKGQPINITVSNTVGDVASKTALDRATTEIVDGIRSMLKGLA